MTLEDEPLRSEGVIYATGEEWRAITNSSRKNEVAGPKQKQPSLLDVSDGESKIQCCKEQYCIGTWSVKSMNQGKLYVVKQKMARVNINILGIIELNWTRMGGFNSYEYYIYYCGQESLGRNGVILISQQKSLKCSTWAQSQEQQNDLCKPFNITVIQVYAPITNAEEVEIE